jgi:hypothetical protein
MIENKDIREELKFNMMKEYYSKHLELMTEIVKKLDKIEDAINHINVDV